ncbi:hypothetical protein B0T21DRAFT_437158 [Apiosordaria backusii]|uniref:Uncharacterized protein n=1 Tax=Apiosordaria backusii TaxID=314023 RepID=A0AA40BT13_9PEZI|nr:hypothetical protein B0T21DRAFT_437158 [Apiosordaria backusii]
MADRHHNPLPPSSRLITTTTAHITTKPSSRLIQQPPGPSTSTTQPPTASSVRRNLFQSQLTRRPPTTTPPPQPPSPPPPPHSPSADIVPRNSLGEIELGDPPTPPLYDTDDDNNNNHNHPSSPSHHSHPHHPHSNNHNPNDHQKTEQAAARHRLSEAVRQHQLHQNKLLMSVPGAGGGNMGGMGIHHHPPINQPEGKKTYPLFNNPSSSFLLFPSEAPHCSDPFCSGPSSSSPKFVYYPGPDPFLSSSPKDDDVKGKGKMVDFDEHGENENESGLAFAKTKYFTEAELVEEVKTSLRAKVAALAQDNWMFEPEELPRPH